MLRQKHWGPELPAVRRKKQSIIRGIGVLTKVDRGHNNLPYLGDRTNKARSEITLICPEWGKPGWSLLSSCRRLTFQRTNQKDLAAHCKRIQFCPEPREERLCKGSPPQCIQPGMDWYVWFSYCLRLRPGNISPKGRLQVKNAKMSSRAGHSTYPHKPAWKNWFMGSWVGPENGLPQ